MSQLPPPRPLDAIDRDILQILQADGRASIRSVAERVHVSRANAYARINRLIEDGVIRGLVERLLGEMRYALGGIVTLEPTVTGVEYSPQFAQVAGAADVMVVVNFELRIGERPHRVTVCLPFGGLLPHLTNAAGPGAVSAVMMSLSGAVSPSLRASLRPSRSTATSFAPRSSRARSAAPARRFARASAQRPASTNVVTAAAVSR